MFVTAGTKIMESLLCVPRWRFGVVYPFGFGLSDAGNAEMHGFVTKVTAANRLVHNAYRVMAGGAIHIVEVAVMLVCECYRAELGC